MLLKEYGFRPVYHNVCAFKLNSKLRDLLSGCPEIEKASHAVCYGYIDAKKGLMLEVLCAGKQTSKKFYFKDLYEGDRITIPASDLKNIEFECFPELEPRFRKKLNPRIEPLSKYDAPEDLEHTRSVELGFLDGVRDLQHPDIVKVTIIKYGFENEEVPIRITNTRDRCLVGVVHKKTKQDFGLSKGESVEFYARMNDKKSVEIFLDMNVMEQELTPSVFENGSFLKYCIVDYLKDNETSNQVETVFRVLRSSKVIIPYDLKLSDQANKIITTARAEGRDVDTLNEEENRLFRAGLHIRIRYLTKDGKHYFPVFTNEEEAGDQMEDAYKIRSPFMDVLGIAAEDRNRIEAIVVNAFSDNFIVPANLFELIANMDPVFPEIDEESDNFERHLYRYTDKELLSH